PLRRVAVEPDLLQPARDPLPQLLAQAQQPLRLLGQRFSAQLARRAQADDVLHRQRAAAHAALVAAAVDERVEADAWVLAAAGGRPLALGPVDLVGRDAQQVDAHRLDVERHLAGGLHGVGVEQDALLLADFADLLNRLYGADLVVGGHEADEDRLRRQRLRHLPRRHLAAPVHRRALSLGPPPR